MALSLKPGTSGLRKPAYARSSATTSLEVFILLQSLPRVRLLVLGKLALDVADLLASANLVALPQSAAHGQSLRIIRTPHDR